MAKDPKYIRQTYSYLALRKAIGWIGILLPFTLMLGAFLIFKEDIIQSSISHYYYTGMRDVFVGALCAIALFMFYYCGYDKWDNWAGHAAGFFALGVALFPTTEFGPSDLIGKIHFACAALLFITLIIFSLCLFTKKEKGSKRTQQKKARDIIYKTCGIIMIVCMIAIVIYKNFIQSDDDAVTSFVFWAETVALVSFGVSWLTKGGTLYPDK